MIKLLTPLLALAVACVTGLAHSQTPVAAPATAPMTAPVAAAVPAQAPGPTGAKTVQAKVAVCIGCHGIPGYQASFPEVYRVPMISGQNAKYIIAALNAYKAGDRKHPTMRGISSALSDQDMNDIGAYYEAHGREGAKVVAPTASREPNAKVAALLQKAACASCHGANFSKPIDPSYPKIAGQHPDYLFVALKAYKIENNATSGRNNAVMSSIARQFSNDELKALSKYVSSLDGELQTRPQSKFR